MVPFGNHCCTFHTTFQRSGITMSTTTVRANVAVATKHYIPVKEWFVWVIYHVSRSCRIGFIKSGKNALMNDQTEYIWQWWRLGFVPPKRFISLLLTFWKRIRSSHKYTSTHKKHLQVSYFPYFLNNTFIIKMCDFLEQESLHTSNNKLRGTNKKQVRDDMASSSSSSTSLEDSLSDERFYQDMSPPQASSIRKTSKSSSSQKSDPKKTRRFSDQVEVFIIPDLDENSINDLFYSEEEMADMRHEAFLESCGLSIEDFGDL